MRIIYKDKRNSSGLVKHGELILYVSSRLPQAEKQRHIELLTAKLTAKLNRMQDRTRESSPTLPSGLTPSPVADDRALAVWAADINKGYYGFAMGQVRFRRQESRWGSCSARTRNIQISHRLRGGPHELLEYVLVHEIAHLGQFNHGPQFWALVASACPDYRQKRRLLKQYEEYLWVQGPID